MNCLPNASSAAAQVRPADKWITRAAAATVAGQPGIAAAPRLPATAPGLRPDPPAGPRPPEIRSEPAEPRPQEASSPPAPGDPAPGSRITALLPAARAARDALHHDDQPLPRDTLAARLRQ